MKRRKRHLLYGLRTEESSFNGIWLLALLYFGSLVSGAVLSLVAFKLVHAFDPDGSSYFAQKQYPNYFDRARWVSVLLLLPYLFAKCQITSFKAIGFSKPSTSTVVQWFLSGMAMIAVIYGFNVSIGAYSVNWDTQLIVSKIPEALVGAVLIGVLEEIVFRGLVFKMFYTAMNPVPAIILSSLFFAVLHFKTPNFTLGDIAPSEVGFREAGLIALGTITAVVTEFDLKYLLAITFVGIVLHQAFLLTNNLWASIGLHAGWVFTIKLFSNVFSNTESANVFTGTNRVADGYWVSIVLVSFIILYSYLLIRSRPNLSYSTHEQLRA